MNAFLLLEIDDKIVSRHMGHATVWVTLDTYLHVTPGLKEAAALRFEEGLRRPILHPLHPA